GSARTGPRRGRPPRVRGRRPPPPHERPPELDRLPPRPRLAHDVTPRGLRGRTARNSRGLSKNVTGDEMPSEWRVMGPSGRRHFGRPTGGHRPPRAVSTPACWSAATPILDGIGVVADAP